MMFSVGVIDHPALADQIEITYSAAGEYTPNFSAICAGAKICDYGVENFSTWNGTSPLTSTFRDGGTGTFNQPSGVTFTGTYSVGSGTTTGAGGQFVSTPQNQYGGAGAGNYPELYGPTSGVANVGAANPASYNLSLAATGVPGVNYFGLWISALDSFNDLKLYDGSKMVAEFNSPLLLQDLGSCANAQANAYCGNPTPQFRGDDSSELFAYVNVYDLNGYISNVTFLDSGYSGFESDNQSVGYVHPLTVVGTNESDVGEPGSLALFCSGLVVLAGLLRARNR